jgi:phage repressor protein C with HTH and peptisase S24 domain
MSDFQFIERGSRLRQIRENLGFDGRKRSLFANVINYAQSNLGHMEVGRKDVPISIAEILSKKYNVSSDWLLFGIGSMYNDDTVKPGEISPIRWNVSLFNIDALAGIGMDINKHEEIIERWYIPSLAGDHIAVTVKGSSMESTLMDGDKVIAKHVTSPEDIRHNSIYIIVYDGSPMIKRVHLVPGGVELRSDNVFFPAIIADMTKVGDMYKVVGYYRSFNVVLLEVGGAV